MLPAIRGTVGSAWGTVEEALTVPLLPPPPASRLWDSSLYCFHSAFLWCILNFVSHTLLFLPLSWAISQSAPALLDEGQKHDCYEKPLTS